MRRAHTAIANASAISGHIALVVRGEASFTEKAAAVQQAGAVGMIAANTEDVLGQLGGDAPVRPPSPPRRTRHSSHSPHRHERRRREAHSPLDTRGLHVIARSVTSPIQYECESFKSLVP